MQNHVLKVPSSGSVQGGFFVSESEVHLLKIWDQTNAGFRVRAVSGGTLVAICSLNQKCKCCKLAQLEDMTGKPVQMSQEWGCESHCCTWVGKWKCVWRYTNKRHLEITEAYFTVGRPLVFFQADNSP